MNEFLTLPIILIIISLICMFCLSTLKNSFKRKSNYSSNDLSEFDENKLSCLIRFLKSKAAKPIKGFSKVEIEDYLNDLEVDFSYFNEAIKRLEKGYRIKWGNSEIDSFVIIDRF